MMSLWFSLEKLFAIKQNFAFPLKMDKLQINQMEITNLLNRVLNLTD